MSKNITTKVTIQNLAAQIKKDFVKKSAFTPCSAGSGRRLQVRQG